MYKNINYQRLRFHLFSLIMSFSTFFLCSSAFAQNSNSSETIPVTEYPRLKLAQTTHDFGDVWQGGEVDCNFVLCNEGSGDLTILKQKTTCGCTVAKPINSSISPGSEKTLNISFAVGNRVGRNIKHVLLYTNDPQQPKVVLTVTANVKQYFILTPRELDFGDIAIGTTVTKEIELTCKENPGPIKIKTILPSSKYISAEVIENAENGCKLAVAITPTVVTEVSEMLGIIVQEKGLPVAKLPIKANVHSQFFVNPSRIFFGLVKSGQQVTRTITVGAPASDKLEKLSFSGCEDNENVQIVSQPDEGNRYTVQITWSPKEDSKNINYNLIITVVSSSGIVETIDIPCYGLISR